MFELILIAILSYLLGSIPFSYLVARAYSKNLYEIGSKNIGAANVYRATGKIEALLMAVIGDIGKGTLSIFLAQRLGLRCDPIFVQALAAFFVVLGHNWPLYLDFKGGRGLASLAGVIIALNWKLIFLVLLTIGFFIFLTELIMRKKITLKGKGKEKINPVRNNTSNGVKGLFSIFISQVAGRMIGILAAVILVLVLYPEIFKIVLPAVILSAIKHIKRTKTFLEGGRV